MKKKKKVANGQTVNTARSADSHLIAIRKGHSSNANVSICARVCVGGGVVSIKMWIK